MKTQAFTIDTDPRFEARMANYPGVIGLKLQALRKLVEQVAATADGVVHLEETLKWNEPSFITNIGSTLRMDWKAKSPDQYALYFSCSSKLVDTFRAVYPTQLRYEGKRAVVIDVDDDLPVELLRSCIEVALRYKKVKGLERLGM